MLPYRLAAKEYSQELIDLAKKELEEKYLIIDKDDSNWEDGYDQAMQDFLEYLKYCSTFTDMNGNTLVDNDLHNILIEQFKNYMQDESEN